MRTILAPLPFLFCFSISVSAIAFEFSPSVMHYDPSGRGATQKYSAHNSFSEPIAIEMSAKVREIDENGNELLKPTTDFTIYPKQFTLLPGNTRAIRVTYVGSPALTSELAYRIIAEQLSIDMKKSDANSTKEKNQVKVAINFNFKYETSAYVTPPGAKSNIRLDDFKFLSDGGKKASIELFISNSGSLHQVFKDWTIEFEMGDGEKIKITKADVKEMPQFNILPGHSIKVKLTGLEKIKSKPAKAKLYFEQSE